jgi:hypothetical protein
MPKRSHDNYDEGEERRGDGREEGGEREREKERSNF